MHPINSSNPSSPAPVDRDLLITRLLDARATDTEWLAFRDLTALDRTAWDQVASERRDMMRLEAALAALSRRAENCEMPQLRFEAEPAPRRNMGWKSRGGLVGWAVAAILALGFVAQQSGLNSGVSSGRQTAGIVNVPPTTPELLQKYIEQGRSDGLVLGEVPQRMVVETRPREGGGHEVIFYRLLLERAIVDDNGFRTFSVKEDGEQVLVPTSPPQAAKSSY